MSERTYQNLVAWKEAHMLCMRVYVLTKSFPSDERFRLVSQMCRSAYSVPMNIAEGNAKRSRKEKAHYFEIGLGSLEELHYQCLLAHGLQYLSKENFNELHDKVQRVSYLLTKLRLAFV